MGMFAECWLAASVDFAGVQQRAAWRKDALIQAIFVQLNGRKRVRQIFLRGFGNVDVGPIENQPRGRQVSRDAPPVETFDLPLDGVALQVLTLRGHAAVAKAACAKSKLGVRVVDHTMMLVSPVP